MSRKSEAMKEVKHMQSKSDGTKDMKQMQRSKGKGWDGKSRPSTDLYKKNYNDIFKKEDDELKESYEQSKRNRAERMNDDE